MVKVSVMQIQGLEFKTSEPVKMLGGHTDSYGLAVIAALGGRDGGSPEHAGWGD